MAFPKRESVIYALNEKIGMILTSYLIKFASSVRIFEKAQNEPVIAKPIVLLASSIRFLLSIDENNCK